MSSLKSKAKEKYNYSASKLEGKEFLKEMSSEKMDLLKGRIDEIILWMEERTELNRKITSKLDSEMFDLRKFPLYEHLDEMIGLEEQKMREELEFWRDTIELRRELKEFQRKYKVGLERVKIWRDKTDRDKR